MATTLRSGPLGSAKSAEELLDMNFLHMRSALLETAAAFDRIQRADSTGRVLDDPRFRKLRQACDLLTSDANNRAEQFLVLFSDPT